MEAPVFAGAVVLTLALGIGASTAIFSVFNAVVLAPVPFPDADRLVQLVGTVNGQPNDTGVSPSIYRHLREQRDVIEDVGAYRYASVNYSSDEVLERLAVAQVTEPYFRTFRAPMALGRSFAVDEDLPGAAKTAVVSYDFWTRRLGRNPSVVGSTIRLNGIAHTVVGVTAQTFDTREFGRLDLWVPMQLPATGTDGGAWFQAAARLKPGVALEQAQAELAASTVSFDRTEAAALSENVRFGAVPFKDALIATGSSTLFRNDPRSVLWMMFGAVGCVLLIACANVANLMLVRASAHERELAVRIALGAGRWRIVRQLLAESVILSAAGGALGLVAGYAGIRALSAVSTVGFSARAGGSLRRGRARAGLPRRSRPRAASSSVWRRLFRLSGLHVNAALKDGGRGALSGRQDTRLAGLLVMGEVALAVVCCSAPPLMTRSFLNIYTADLGVNTDGLLSVTLRLPPARYPDAERDLQVRRSPPYPRGDAAGRRRCRRDMLRAAAASLGRRVQNRR